MKRWEAKVLGFATPWWLLALTFIGESWLGYLPVLQLLLALGVGFKVAMSVGTAATAENAKLEQVVAGWFVLGILSLFVLPILVLVTAVLIIAVISVCGALVSL